MMGKFVGYVVLILIVMFFTGLAVSASAYAALELACS